MRTSRYALPALIVILVVVCFSPVLGYGFLNWDDNLTFTENWHYRGLSFSHLKWMFTTTHVGQYRPLTWVTYGVDYVLWGMDPRGYHLSNLLLHAANGVVLYLLIDVLVCRRSVDRQPSNRLAIRAAAAIGALFFALHPLRVEAVAWATERQEVLCGVFCLLTLLAYLRMEEEKRAGGTAWRRWYLMSIGAFALSLLAKPAGLMLPFVLLVLDVYPLARFERVTGRSPAAVLIEKIPYTLLAGAAVTLAFFAKEPQAIVPLAEYGVIQRSMQAAYGLCFYVWKTVAPFQLSPLYLLHRPLDLAAPKYIIAPLLVIGITGCLVVRRHRWPWALTAWVCYALLVLPVLGFVQNGVQIAADRYTYIPCLVWAVLIGTGAHQLWLWCERRRLSLPLRYSIAAVIVATLAGFGVLTREQVHVWSDSITLWNHVLQIEPNNYIAYLNRGGTRREQGDLDGALADFNDVIRLNPAQAEAHSNRGDVRRLRGDLDGALADLNQALRLDPEQPDAYTNRGTLRQAKGDIGGALVDFSTAIRLNPEHTKAYNNRGTARQARGDLEGAIVDFNQALRLNPAYANAYDNRGNARQAKGDLDGALADFDTAIRLDPQGANTYFNRGNARKAKGDVEGALADYSAAISLNPQFAGAYNNRGNARRARGDIDGALADFSEALRLNPQHANAYNNRGIVRQARGDLEGAVADYAQAVQFAPPGAAYRATFERNLAAAQALAQAPTPGTTNP